MSLSEEIAGRLQPLRHHRAISALDRRMLSVMPTQSLRTRPQNILWVTESGESQKSQAV